MGPLYIRRKHSSLLDALTVNILAGGDNCSRAIVLGPMYVVDAFDGTGDGNDDTSGDNNTPKDQVPRGWIDAMNKDLWNRLEVMTNKVQ